MQQYKITIENGVQDKIEIKRRKKKSQALKLEFMQIRKCNLLPKRHNDVLITAR